MFGGVGGFRLALEKCNHDKQPKAFRCVGYCDNNKHAVRCYNENFNEKHEATDVTRIQWNEETDFNMLCAGFPCQAFSIAGKRRGFSDTRGTLFFEVARCISYKKPALLFLENVKGLLSHDEGRTFRTILMVLDELGYDCEWQVLNSKDFGVPQNRERVFIIGRLRWEKREMSNRSGSAPRGRTREVRSTRVCDKVFPIFGEGCPPLSSILEKEVPEKYCLSEKQAQKLASELPTHTPSLLSVLTPGREHKRQNGPRFKEREMFTLTGQDIHGVFIQSAQPRCGDPKRGGTGPLRSTKYSFTLDSQPHYVNAIRKLTPVECERLQGFPDNWTAMLSDTQRYKAMGNAVTVNVINAIGRKLMDVIRT